MYRWELEYKNAANFAASVVISVAAAMKSNSRGGRRRSSGEKRNNGVNSSCCNPQLDLPSPPWQPRCHASKSCSSTASILVHHVFTSSDDRNPEKRSTKCV
ncbi:unnamed protein product [Linum trigynum]|uniref:Uncharacterized protein n=1 Tax=Linum trigynum TaxID=586398 RepID=A0AAV2FTU0_9ROSI